MDQLLNGRGVAQSIGTAAGNTESLPLVDARTPVNSLIHLLAGSAGGTLADSGITRLSGDQLHTLSVHAGHESESCLERALLLLRLMEHTLEHGCPPPSDELLTIAQQIIGLLQDHERWHTLADNAAYYREQPQIAARILALRYPQDHGLAKMGDAGSTKPA
jgi:hypothetical protein